MNELQQESGPVNPYAKTFFWLWAVALLALSGFRSDRAQVNKWQLPHSISWTNAINWPTNQAQPIACLARFFSNN